MRAHLARGRVKTSTVAACLDLSLPATHKRLNGTVPFSVDELAQVAQLIGVDVTALIPAVEQVPA